MCFCEYLVSLLFLETPTLRKTGVIIHDWDHAEEREERNLTALLKAAGVNTTCTYFVTPRKLKVVWVHQLR